MFGCPSCEGPGVLMGTLGNRDHYRCRDCGWDYSVSVANVRVLDPDWMACSTCGSLHEEDYCPVCEEFSQESDNVLASADQVV